MTKVIGKVDNWSLTHGGAGNQWTVIDGIKYATYWDFQTMDWNTGDTVEFEVIQQPLWTGSKPIAHAQNIKKHTPVETIIPEDGDKDDGVVEISPRPRGG